MLIYMAAGRLSSALQQAFLVENQNAFTLKVKSSHIHCNFVNVRLVSHR